MEHPLALRLYYDYADPSSYLMERRLRPMEGPTTFVLDLEPFEACPPPAPLRDPSDPVFVEGWRNISSTAEREGVRLREPRIVPWTRKAHELGFLAREAGCFREIHETLFRAYLLEGMDIGRVDVLVGLAGRHGLDSSRTKAALDVDLRLEAVLRSREMGLGEGVIRPPTISWLDRKAEGLLDHRSLAAFLDLDGRHEH
jgi:predicted DsbA family dithiol-disulfide isomerase